MPLEERDNAHVISALEGQNIRQIIFISLNPRCKNTQGEVLDEWGTPLRIIMADPHNPVIRSAGPDKIWGTQDDLASEKGQMQSGY